MDLDRWFIEEILPFERALDRFIASVEPGHVDDLRQEVYARTYAAALRQQPAEPRPFLFAIARNLMIDRLRRTKIVQMDQVAEIDALLVVSEDIPADRVVSSRQELKRVMLALDSLPPRCREVVRLRKIEGLPPREIAAQLGIAVDTVDKQIAKGMKLLADLLARDETTVATPTDRSRVANEQR